MTHKTPSRSTTLRGTRKIGASRIVVEVSGGVVQAIFADGAIGVDVIDLDNAKATNTQTVFEAEQFLQETRKTLKTVY